VLREEFDGRAGRRQVAAGAQQAGAHRARALAPAKGKNMKGHELDIIIKTSS
jgi:hypothetical protein